MGKNISSILCGMLLLFSAVGFLSCDVGYCLPVENKPEMSKGIVTETGTVRIDGMYFQRLYYFNCDLKGSYVINIDSLKLNLSDDNLILRPNNIYISRDIKSKNNASVKNILIQKRLIFDRKDKTKEIQKPLLLTVLPSDFIMCNGKRIINDTLIIELKDPRRAIK